MADARTAAGVAPPAIAYIAISPRTGHVALRPRIGRSAPCTILANMATLRPLSTSRWMRPVAMSAFSSCVGMPSRTPRTIPRRTAAAHQEMPDIGDLRLADQDLGRRNQHLAAASDCPAVI